MHFDWWKEKFFTLINSVSANLGTISLPLVPNYIYHNISDIFTFFDKAGTIRNDLLSVWIASMCKLWQIDRKMDLLSLRVIIWSLYIHQRNSQKQNPLILPLCILNQYPSFNAVVRVCVSHVKSLSIFIPPQ